MSSLVTLNYSKAIPFFGRHKISDYQKLIRFYHDKIHNPTYSNTMLGWLDIPENLDREELGRIKRASAIVRGNSDILLVIGIGGSYIGSRAAIELLTHSFYNHLSKEDRGSPQIFFAGNNLSPTYMTHLLDLLKEKDFSINVISKSGTTLEPAIAFRIFRKLLEEKYGNEESQSRIFITTDKSEGPLKAISSANGYETFTIPDNVGGRYSVLTAVGLFPISVCGIQIDDILKGAALARRDLSNPDVSQNPAYQYAAIRNILYKRGKTIEILVSNEPRFHSFFEWWKQLYAENEGKDLKGIFPASANFTTDLHSLGQYIQDGSRNLFETVIKVGKNEVELLVEHNSDDIDGLNILSGKSVGFINSKAIDGSLVAHSNGGVPNMVVNVPEISPFTFGYLVYFFLKASAMSAYLLGVDPFNQPGVEAYKREMYDLLGKPLE